MMDSIVSSAEIPVIEKNILIIEDETMFAKAVKNTCKEPVLLLNWRPT